MGRNTIQLETAVSTISSEYLLEFNSEHGIAEELHSELPSPGDRIMDFSEDERVFPTVVDWRVSAPKDEMPVAGSYSPEDVVVLNTRRTPIQKQPEALLCLVGLSRKYFLVDDVYPTFLNDDDREMDLFNLISAPNPTKVKTGTRPRAAHEVPLLIATATRVIAMEDATGLSSSSGTPSTVEKSPLDFSNEDSPRRITESDGTENQGQETVAPEVPPQENVPTVGVTPEIGLEKEVAAMGPLSTIGEKSTRLYTGSTLSAPTLQETPADVSDPDPLSYAKPQSIPEREIAQSSKGATVAGDPDSEKSTSFTSFTGSPSGIYRPGWGVINSCRLKSPDVCQDVVDHIVPPGYFSELRHLRNEDFFNQYNMNLARQVAMGSQLRLRFEQEVRLLKRATKKGLRNQMKNLEALLEAEVDMKKVAEANNVELVEELESLSAKFSDLQVNNTQLSQQVSSLQAQITGDERIKAAFKEFKRYEDDKVEQRCVEMDARLDKLSIDFDEELYPHILTAIAGCRWLIGHDLRLAVLKCAESLEIRQAFADVVSAGLAKGDVEACDPEANDKFVKALQDMKDLKYPIVDQLERLKDSLIDLIMASLHLKSDTGEDAPQWIRDLRPSSSQLKIPIYLKVCDPKDPWAVKEEISLEDAIAANISRVEKKKKCRVVCRTHGVSSAHNARSDGVVVSVLTAAPQGLAILLTDAAT
ncbi:hypothetical protein Tco_0750125 [Tanacetum coccineum]|uniref:Transposase (Putative), gypsy type n=1 Tax=Tanacetum coccineum TaxID=301880 RepID=A0ABQ4Z0B6_9ASTR